MGLFLNYTYRLYSIIEFYKYKFHDSCYNNTEQLEKLLCIESVNMLISSSEETIFKSIQYVTTNIIKEKIDELNEYSTDAKKTLKFLIAAFTDELIIREIREKDFHVWNVLLLEKYFFGTAIAGEKVIEIIKEHNEYHSNKNNALSIINYYIICCGFTGIYKHNIDELQKLKVSTFKILRNDFNIQDILDNANIDIHSYEIIKGPSISKIRNYKNIYFNIFISLVVVESVYLFYLVFKYCELKFRIC